MVKNASTVQDQASLMSDKSRMVHRKRISVGLPVKSFYNTVERVLVSKPIITQGKHKTFKSQGVSKRVGNY